MRPLVILLALVCGGSAAAESVYALRTIRPGNVITAADVRLTSNQIPGGAQTLESVVGQEARVALYSGRPILTADVGPPAIVDRNEIIVLTYQNGGLTITAEGRALDRAGIGDRLRVMNIASRTVVSAQIMDDGSIQVSN